MSILFFSLLFIVSACGFVEEDSKKLIKLEPLLLRPNFFDHEYKTFSKDSFSERLFGFNSKMVCQMEQNAKGWSVSFQNVINLAKTASVQLNLDGEMPTTPIACFEHNLSSYIFIVNEINKEISIFRGQFQKIFINFLDGRVAYDYLARRFFIVNQNNVIREISLKNLENIWNDHNHTKIFTLKSRFIGRIPINYTDLIFVDSKVYLINQRFVYSHSLNLKNWQNNSFLPITNISDTVFNFLIFKEGKEKVLNSAFQNENTTKLWLFLLYLINAFLIVLCAWVIKKLRGNGLISGKRSTKNSTDSYFWDNIPLAPLPPTPPFLMEAYPNSLAINTKNKKTNL